MPLSVEEKNILRESDIIVIIGFPATGKTTLSIELQEELLPEHSLYSSDNYIDLGYEQSLYGMIKEIETDPNPKKIIEGVQGYRFLRKMAQKGGKVDAVITVHCDAAERARRYQARNKGNLPESFDRNLRTVFSDYLTIMHSNGQPLPRFINITT